MATKKQTSTPVDDVDDLLGDLPTAEAPKPAAKKKSVVPVKKGAGDAEEVDSAEALTAALAGEAPAKTPKEKKEKEPKAPRSLKGVPVTFTTKGTGEKVTGLGVLYYVTRMDGKLYYKEASQVHVLTDEEVAALNTEPEVALPEKKEAE